MEKTQLPHSKHATWLGSSGKIRFKKLFSEIENEIDSIQNDINETIDAGIQMAKDAAEAVGNGIQAGLNVCF